MTEPAQQLGPQYKFPPLYYKGMVFGLEPLSDCYPEFVVLSAREWEEVGNNERYGQYMPDLELGLQYEAAGAFFLFTVRDQSTMELVGYFVITVAPSLKQRGRTVAQDSGMYLTPEARQGRPWMMAKFLKFLEKAFATFGIHTLEVGHHPDDNGWRAGKFYERQGYTPSAATYIKVLEDG